MIEFEPIGFSLHKRIPDDKDSLIFTLNGITFRSTENHNENITTVKEVRHRTFVSGVIAVIYPSNSEKE
jgi:hypothetical protein